MTESKWWHNNFDSLAARLPPSILKEMKHRIENTRINGIKLELKDQTKHMKEFFEKEIARNEKRKDANRERQNSKYGLAKGKINQLAEETNKLVSERDNLRKTITEMRKEIDGLKSVKEQNEQTLDKQRSIINALRLRVEGLKP